MVNTSRKVGFARRFHISRAIGLVLVGIAFIPAFLEIGHPLWVWLVFALYLLLWPHLAHIYSTNYSDSLLTGQRHLLFDSFCCSIGVAAIHFHLMPSAILLSMVALNNISTGGMRFFGKGLVYQCLGLVGGAAVFGWSPQLESSILINAASIPMLAVYPLALGLLNYGFSIRIHEQKKQLKQLSRTDGLTGLYNRRYWQLRATEEFDRCQRNANEAVLMMIDIDHFKSINDTYGHGVGDEVIRGIADILQRQLRNIDITGRFGGEEFAVVLPEISIHNCKKVVERLRATVANEVIGDNTPVQCTISLGLAAFDKTMQSVDDWVNAADAALYQAKDRGRNCFCVYSPNNSLRVVSTQQTRPTHAIHQKEKE